MSTTYEKIRQVALSPAFWCAAAIGLCVLAAHPFLEMGFDDDFSYIYSAKVLATTGHVVYNDWATAMLGWQLYLGALFIKVFGFSFTAIRMSMLLVAMATGTLMQRIFVHAGINAWNATLATLTFTLSPLYLPLAFSFMTDIPGLLAILICIYGCIRAVEANSTRSAIYWIIFAAVTNSIGGTVRQIAWLGVLVMVPSAAWLLRKRQGVVATASVAWICSAAFIAGCMSWFKKQPYSVNEPLAVHLHLFTHKYFAIFLFALPVLSAFAWRYPIRERWAQLQGGLVAAVTLLPFAAYIVLRMSYFKTHPASFLAPFSELEVTAKGFDIGSLPGTRPDVLPLWVEVLLTGLTLLSTLAFVIVAVNARRLKSKPVPADRISLSAETLTLLLGPFTLAYIALMITRTTVFERYFLPLLFILLVGLLRSYQSTLAVRLPAWSVALVVLFAAYSIAILHDVTAANRARLEAANHLQAAGVQRNEIRAGFEYDGWTQIELTGHLAPIKRPHLPPCTYWWESDSPAIHGVYELSYDQGCFPLSELPAVEYHTWLSPHVQHVYTLKLPQP